LHSLVKRRSCSSTKSAFAGLLALLSVGCDQGEASESDQSGGSGGTAGASGAAGSGGGAGGRGGAAGSAGTSGAAGSSGMAGSAGASGASGSAGAGGAGGGGSFRFGIKAASADPQHALTAYSDFKASFFVECSGNRVRVATASGSQETVSEGMGYAMLMVAYLEPDATGPLLMNRLLAFVNSKLDAQQLMHWKVSCDSVIEQNAATDGDLDYALALIQAERRWPNQNFGTAARKFLDAILRHETDGCGLKPGDVWGGCNNEANPSYAATGYLETFRCFTGNAAWSTVRSNTMTRQLAYWHANYALPPDWVQVDTGSSSGRFSRGAYRYDAARVPWRLGLDYLWHGGEDAGAQAHKIVNHFKNVASDPSTIGDGYDYQSGNKLSNNHNAVFVAPLAIGAMVHSNHQDWLNRIYAELVDLQQGTYYSDALRVIGLMAANGLYTNPCQ
jgi:endoglucanase